MVGIKMEGTLSSYFVLCGNRSHHSSIFYKWFFASGKASENIMGLLTKEVEVGLCSKNIGYYENLGYEIPRYYNKNSCTWRVKRSAKIIVDINHLSPYARYKVDVDCDCCGKHL